MSYKLKTRYIVINVPVAATIGLNIIPISHKIPKNFVVVDGFMAIVRKDNPTPPDATVSVTFNNRTITPLTEIEAEKTDGTRRKRKLSFWPVNEQVQDGSTIGGFIESDNKVLEAYNIKLIFRGKRMIKTD
ncbi:MAG: hypothetical protein Q7W13_13060 [Bacteroidia bacterium]|nr:hypothetical protein [Bacteroidia bacterium]